MEIKQLYKQYWHDRINLCIKAYVDFWKHLVDFKGTVGRWDYIRCSIASNVAIIAISIVLSIICGVTKSAIPAAIFGVAYLIGCLSITIRRLHDVGRRWLTLLWLLVPIVGTFILIFAMISPGKDELLEMYGQNNSREDVFKERNSEQREKQEQVNNEEIIEESTEDNNLESQEVRFD